MQCVIRYDLVLTRIEDYSSNFIKCYLLQSWDIPSFPWVLSKPVDKDGTSVLFVFVGPAMNKQRNSWFFNFDSLAKTFVA